MFKITREAQKAKTQSEKRFSAWSVIYMSGQIDWQTRSLSGQTNGHLAGHCLLTGCYFEPCKGKTSVKYAV